MGISDTSVFSTEPCCFLMTKNWDVNEFHKEWDQVPTIPPAAGLKDHQKEEG